MHNEASRFGLLLRVGAEASSQRECVIETHFAQPNHALEALSILALELLAAAKCAELPTNHDTDFGAQSIRLFHRMCGQDQSASFAVGSAAFKTEGRQGALRAACSRPRR